MVGEMGEMVGVMRQQSVPNPIRKFVGGQSVGFGRGSVVRIHLVWGFQCECGKEGKHAYYGQPMRTRKQARDAYYRHQQQDHGGLGQVPNRHGTYPAPPSPRQGLAETSAKRDELVEGSTPSPATTSSGTSPEDRARPPFFPPGFVAAVVVIVVAATITWAVWG